MRFLTFIFFLLISCGGGSGNTSIKDNSTDLDENSVQDSNSETSRIIESISINDSISTSGEEDNIANVFGKCVFGGCKFE